MAPTRAHKHPQRYNGRHVTLLAPRQKYKRSYGITQIKGTRCVETGQGCGTHTALISLSSAHAGSNVKRGQGVRSRVFLARRLVPYARRLVMRIVQ